MANDCIPFYRPGADLTVHAAAALTGKRFVDVTAVSSDGNITVNKPSAGGKVLGVLAFDVASGKKGTAICGPGTVLPVTANGNIAVGAEVEVDAEGRVVTLASGTAVGRCLNAASTTVEAKVKLY